jgi:hypothetical protein
MILLCSSRPIVIVQLDKTAGFSKHQSGRTTESSPVTELSGCASVAHPGSGVPGKEQKNITLGRRLVRSPLLGGAL